MNRWARKKFTDDVIIISRVCVFYFGVSRSLFGVAFLLVVIEMGKASIISLFSHYVSSFLISLSESDFRSSCLLKYSANER